jgi:hypothetical protein
MVMKTAPTRATRDFAVSIDKLVCFRLSSTLRLPHLGDWTCRVSELRRPFILNVSRGAYLPRNPLRARVCSAFRTPTLIENFGPPIKDPTSAPGSVSVTTKYVKLLRRFQLM